VHGPYVVNAQYHTYENHVCLNIPCVQALKFYDYITTCFYKLPCNNRLCHIQIPNNYTIYLQADQETQRITKSMTQKWQKHRQVSLKLTLVNGDVCITEHNQTNGLQQQHTATWA